MVDQFFVQAGQLAHFGRNRHQVVGDQYDRHVRIDFPEQLIDLVPRVGVDAGGRFIQQQQFGLDSQGSGDQQPLEFSTR